MNEELKSEVARLKDENKEYEIVKNKFEAEVRTLTLEKDKIEIKKRNVTEVL